MTQWCCICGGEIAEGMLGHSVVTTAANAPRWLKLGPDRIIPMTPLSDGQVRLDYCRACMSAMEEETQSVLREELARLRRLTYAELVRRIDGGDDSSYWTDVIGPSGAQYPLEIMIFWDDSREKKNVRVIVSIAAGFTPPSDDFIMAPDGSFVGE